MRVNREGRRREWERGGRRGRGKAEEELESRPEDYNLIYLNFDQCRPLVSVQALVSTCGVLLRTCSVQLMARSQKEMFKTVVLLNKNI